MSQQDERLGMSAPQRTHRKVVYELLHRGKSVEFVAEVCQVSTNTDNTWRRDIAQGHDYRRSEGSGRPSELSDVIRQSICDLIPANRNFTYSQFSQLLLQENVTRELIPRSTLQDWFDKIGISYRSHTFKPPLNANQMANRLLFAHLLNVNQPRKLAFGDEAAFRTDTLKPTKGFYLDDETDVYMDQPLRVKTVICRFHHLLWSGSFDYSR